MSITESLSKQTDVPGRHADKIVAAKGIGRASISNKEKAVRTAKLIRGLDTEPSMWSDATEHGRMLLALDPVPGQPQYFYDVANNMLVIDTTEI